MEVGVMDDGVPLKKQKVLERCKFWPVCKSGDECLYHHPTTQCKWEFKFSLQTFVHTASANLKIYVFPFPKGPFPTVNLGTNAFLSIQIVNLMPGAPNQIVPSLTSAAEAQLLLSPGQVSRHTLVLQHKMHRPLTARTNASLSSRVHSGAASQGCKCVSLLPRMQECRLSVLSPKGKKNEIDLIVWW